MSKIMIDRATLTNRAFYTLIAYAVLLGAIVGLATAVFLLAEHWLTELLWETIPHQIGEFSLYTLLLCTIGGLLIGLGQRFLGDWPKPMQDALEDVRMNGGFDTAHIWHGVVISLISLAFGAALGPEAALIGLAGGLATWVSRRLKVTAQQAHSLTYFSVSGALGAFFRSPFGSATLPLESAKADSLPSTWTLIPGVFAGAAGLLVMILLAGDTLRTTYDYLPYISPRDGSDMLLAIPFGLLGAGIGWLYLKLHHHIDHLLQPIKTQKIGLGLVGGMLLGLLATFSPLVLFSGQSGLNELFVSGVEIGPGMLILIGLAKLIALIACIATGWKGGEFFPIMFSGAAVGMGVAYLIPAIDPMVGLAAAMAAATSAMLRKPLATILIVVLFMPASLIIPITIGAFIGSIITTPFQITSDQG